MYKYYIMYTFPAPVIGIQMTSKCTQFKGEMLQTQENQWYRKHLETLRSSIKKTSKSSLNLMLKRRPQTTTFELNSPSTEVPQKSTLDVAWRYKTTPSVDRNLTTNNDTEKTSLRRHCAV